MVDDIAGPMNFNVTLFGDRLDEVEDGFELIDGDVLTQMVDGVPNIQFSDRYVCCSIRVCPHLLLLSYLGDRFISMSYAVNYMLCGNRDARFN